jgi:hypothetical protein
VVAQDNNVVKKASQEVCFRVSKRSQMRRNQFRKGISQDGKIVSRVVQKWFFFRSNAASSLCGTPGRSQETASQLGGMTINRIPDLAVLYLQSTHTNWTGCMVIWQSACPTLQRGCSRYMRLLELLECPNKLQHVHVSCMSYNTDLPGIPAQPSAVPLSEENSKCNVMHLDKPLDL